MGGFLVAFHCRNIGHVDKKMVADWSRLGAAWEWLTGLLAAGPRPQNPLMECVVSLLAQASP